MTWLGPKRGARDQPNHRAACHNGIWIVPKYQDCNKKKDQGYWQGLGIENNICGEMNRNEEKCQAVKGSYEKIGAKLRSSESGGELVFLNFEYGGRHPDVEKRNKQAEKDLYAK
jgi:hypothetical protein